MDEKKNLEVSRRNAETVLQVLAKQDIKIQEQQQRIDLLNTAVANLTQKVNQLEIMLMLQKVKTTGSGASVQV